MNDLISRQWLMECVNEGWIKFDTEKDKNRFIHLVRDIAPSAQPEERTETHACDCISRQAAIDFIDAGHLVNPNEPRWSDNEVVNFLKSRPSAQPDRSLWFRIGEVCVGESKGDISAEMAVEKIRELLREAERRKE